MLLKNIIDVDFVNYKKPSMFLGFPQCTFKCEKECGQFVCQNSALINSPNIDVNIQSLVDRYISDTLTHAVVCGGLEPFDSWEDLLKFITVFREKSHDDIVIYTGYTEDEAAVWSTFLRGLFDNIIIKYGRFIPGQKLHFDDVLGVNLASDNQYAKKIS